MREIVHRIDGMMKRVEGIGRAAADVVDQQTRLDQSILSKAFRGELLLQNPNDEPASALLERIRAERAKGAGNGDARSRACRHPPDTN